MTIASFTAIATTRDVEPGTEQAGASGVEIRRRVFTDVVESSDTRLSGLNRVEVDLDVDPATGRGSLTARFTLRPATGGGTWEGEMCGELVNGRVSARGLARGTGALAAHVMRVEFEQLEGHPRTPPVAEPKAFFAMSGLIS